MADSFSTDQSASSSPPESASQSAPVPSGRTLPWLSAGALLVAGVSLLTSAVLWQRLAKTQEELVRRTADTQAEVLTARNLVRQTEALTQDMQARLGVAELRLSEVSLQRSQLEEFLLSFSRSRDDSLVQDLESAVRLAQQQSTLTGNVQPLISALQSAGKRIERASQPRLNPVQRAITRDIERIQAAALVDVPALAQRLDEQLRQVDEMPLVNAAAPNTTPGPSTKVAKPAAPAAQSAQPPKGTEGVTDTGWGATAARWSAWLQDKSGQWWAQVRQGAGDLVRVSRIDQPEAALLSPDQSFFLRENLKLKLMNAHLGVLARHWDSARRDLRSADELLERYFDGTSALTRSSRQALKQLLQDLRHDELPRPDETLAALAAAASGR